MMLITFSLRGQSVEPQVFAITGMTYNSADGTTISLVAGEPLNATLGEGETLITQGFLQPYILPPCVEVDVKFFPNPAEDILNISAIDCELPLERVVIVDLYGRVVAKSPIVESKVSLKDMNPGIYLVQAFLENNVHAGTFKIAKISR